MIKEKVLESKSAYAVSKELGFSKNTVKKYVDPKNTDKHGYPTRASKLDPYKNEIDKLNGLTISNTGLISGRPTITGTYICNVSVNTNWGITNKEITITVE